MCGRYSITVQPDQLAIHFSAALPEGYSGPRLNAAPSEALPVMLNDGSRQMHLLTWGLVPSWSKDAGMSSRLINARAETLTQKPSFREAYLRRRCLVLADGFYEWQKGADSQGRQTKTPMRIALKSGAPFAFAGLWEIWRPPHGPALRTFTIITTEPNELVGPIHNRMPVILDPDAYDIWLDDKAAPAWPALLRAYPAELMQTAPVQGDHLRRAGA